MNSIKLIGLAITAVFVQGVLSGMAGPAPAAAQEVVSPTPLNERAAYGLARGLKYSVRLRTRTLNLEGNLEPQTGDRRHLLVQFWDFPTPEDRADLAALGFHLQKPLKAPIYHVAIVQEGAVASDLLEISLVKWVGYLHPEDKIQVEFFCTSFLFVFV